MKLSFLEVLAYIRYWLLRIATVVVVAPFYITLIADGMKRVAPTMGMKLSKMPFPFMSSFAHYKLTESLHLGHLFALMTCVFVLFFWEKIAELLLCPTLFSSGKLDPVVYKKFIIGMGCTVITVDLVCFYVALSRSTWGGSSFSFKSLIGTVGYAAILISTAFFAVVLKSQLPSSKSHVPTK